MGLKFESNLLITFLSTKVNNQGSQVRPHQVSQAYTDRGYHQAYTQFQPPYHAPSGMLGTRVRTHAGGKVAPRWPWLFTFVDSFLHQQNYTKR